MARPKGGSNRKYSLEEKQKYVELVLSGEKSSVQLEHETGIGHSVIQRWIKHYNEFGVEGLAKTRRTGNPYAALHTSKSLTVEERQRLEIMKLKVENERLKKGYVVKGVGADKEFVSLKDVNTR